MATTLTRCPGPLADCCNPFCRNACTVACFGSDALLSSGIDDLGRHALVAGPGDGHRPVWSRSACPMVAATLTATALPMTPMTRDRGPGNW